MERSEQINELAAALARAQGKYKPVKRTGRNPKFNSRYATLDDVLAAVRKALSGEGLAYTQLVGHDDNGGFTLTTMLLHESGQYLSDTMPVVPESGLVSRDGKKVRTDLQELGNALTYTKRYAAASMFGVNSEVDDDGNSGRTTSKQQAPPPQSEAAKAAREEKRRIGAALNSIKVAWIGKAKEVGFLSESPTSEEWAALIEVMGPTYQLFKDSQSSSQEPELGFDKLKETGLAIIVNRAPRPEQATPEEIEHAANLGAPLDEDTPPCSGTAPHYSDN